MGSACLGLRQISLGWPMDQWVRDEARRLAGAVRGLGKAGVVTRKWVMVRTGGEGCRGGCDPGAKGGG